MKRSAGILLPVSSLPSDYGIGCFSESAYSFVDWLAEAGQSFWQILPLGPTGYGDSPYQSFSTFAGNPYFISLRALTDRGLLTEEECLGSMNEAPMDADRVDYGLLYRERLNILRKAYHRSRHNEDPAYYHFIKENAYWLEDYSLFMALKKYFGGVSFSEWPEALKLHGGQAEALSDGLDEGDKLCLAGSDAGKYSTLHGRFDDKERRALNSLEQYREMLADEIHFQKYMQYEFYMQWKALKAYANSCGIRIIGDIPIYVAMDSADTWANPELFELDGNRTPTAVAGCPPDGFSAKGQLWGNPLYRWEQHLKTGYAWWIQRLKHSFSLYDVVRIDHFRGFDEYYSVPYGAESAQGGHWAKGPGKAFFDCVREALGNRAFIAEDLGYVTDSVRELVSYCGFAGMKVLEFAFDSRDTGCAEDYLPHNYPENSVAYTGTHDNETIAGWFESITEEERYAALSYLRKEKETLGLAGYSTAGNVSGAKTPAEAQNTFEKRWIPGGSANAAGVEHGDRGSEELAWDFIGMVMRSRAGLCVIPMQDYLGLGNSCRMNKPSTLGSNWQWRMRKEQLSTELCRRVRRLTAACGRL